MPNIKAILFDLDGCLVDSEPYCLEVIAKEMNQLGMMEVNPETIGNQFLGISMQVICEYIARVSGKPCPEDFITQVEDKLFSVYRERLQAMEGVWPLLDELQARAIHTGIATGGSIRRMTETLILSGLAERFQQSAFSADQVKHGKPAPDLFLYAAQQLNTPPTQCLVLEDSPHGIHGAIAAGMQAIGFVGGSHLDKKRDQHTTLLRQAGASKVINHLNELIIQLDRIN